MQIRNQSPQMEYRRFGKTNLPLSVITLGGMRFRKNTGGTPRNEVPAEMLEHCTTTLQHAFATGINHIETAHGYGKSENCYGLALNQELNIPRDNYYLMTKGAPMTAAEVRPLIEEQLKALRTDYFDLYAWHGINTAERMEAACKPGGAVEELLKLKEEGVLKNIGFSTHGSLELILGAVNTGLFDFVNLHYYYFFQRNRAAVDEAARRDMGVFIISPNDKGGQLFFAPDSLKMNCQPITPIQWNARFCLSTPAVHTLTFGMNEASHFTEMQGIMAGGKVPWSETDQKTKDILDKKVRDMPYHDIDAYAIPNPKSRINIPEVLRFRKLWKCYDMETYCYYRYNSFEENGHWFPGSYPTEERLALLDDDALPGVPLKDLIRETHEKFYRPKNS